MEPFRRSIEFYRDYFREFYNDQTENVQKKIKWTLDLIRTTQRVPEKYFKHMEGTRGLYEIRVESEGNIFRIFSFFDKGNVIVLGNGFQKKSQKTPKAEIALALRIMEGYFHEKEIT